MNRLNFYTNYGPTYVLYNIGFGGPRNPDELKALSFRCDRIRWLHSAQSHQPNPSQLGSIAKRQRRRFCEPPKSGKRP